MTDNPYAGDFGRNEGIYDGPPRTSALAVTSLVLSLICCIPGLGILGAGLGVGALIGIGGSNGRVGGRGLAVAGIIVGVLVSLAWLGVVLSAQQFMGQASQVLYGTTHSMMTEIEAGDFNAARNRMVGPAANATDEQFEAFRDGYRSAYGSFQDIPTGWMEIFAAYAEIGHLIQNYQGTQNLIPIPVSFDSGRALMIAVVSQHGGPAPGAVIPIEDLWIVLPDGTELRLISSGPAPTPAPAPGGATEADPDEGGADDDEP